MRPKNLKCGGKKKMPNGGLYNSGISDYINKRLSNDKTKEDFRLYSPSQIKGELGPLNTSVKSLEHFDRDTQRTQNPYGEDMLSTGEYDDKLEYLQNDHPFKISASDMMHAAIPALSYLGRNIEQNRQDDYARRQLAMLGQNSYADYKQFQPNPYSLYARFGGNIKKYQTGGKIPYYQYGERSQFYPPIFAEGGEFSVDEFDDEMMKRGGMKKWRGKAGGLTPNKAREILHDKSVHGKELTDKQRRFFGAMSKGHTNYR